MTWTVAEARSVACPKCKAAPGEACRYSGKGAVKAGRRGASHQERIDVMVAARKAKSRKKIPAPRAKAAPLHVPVTITGPLYREGADSF